MILSIILATRDRPEWIRRAIDSVLAQDDGRWELVVLDNGEKSIEALVPADGRIDYHRSSATGPADAFQQALDRAAGDVVMPLADDDTLAPHAVRAVLDGIGEAQWGYAQTAYQVSGQTQFLLGGPWSLQRMRADYYLGGAVFWRVSLTDRLGGFDPAYDGAADYDLYLRFGEDSEPVYIEDVLYFYNDHPGTDSRVRPANQRAKADLIRRRAPRRRVCVVTPWIDHPELLDGYLGAVERADQVIVVLNGGDRGIFGFAGEEVIDRSADPLGFAASNNLGLECATGDVVVFLNNDVVGDPAWIDRVRADVTDGGLYGPSIGQQTLKGVAIPYVEGWCVAATRATWEELGGWDAERFPRPYWEDVELSLRAMRSGVELRRAPWSLRHLGGVSTSSTPGAWDGFEAQRRIVEDEVDAIIGSLASA